MIDTTILIFGSKKSVVHSKHRNNKEAKNVRFLFQKITYGRTKRPCFNGEQQKDIEMKGIILVKVDEM